MGLKKKYDPPKMVGWFRPAQLASTGLKALVSGTFAHYADKRDLQAALDSQVWPIDLSKYDDGNREEIWFDYVSDTGDGFNSTYSVASMVARDLKVEIFKQDLRDEDDENTNIRGTQTKSGDFLILGGDEVYPTPGMDEYDNRFKVPFTSASEKFHSNGKEPLMFAIPGNHDWYDGLSNFLKIFTQERWIGKWRTKQTRSYFAIKLPHNYWLWATDVQLNADIDNSQLKYFQTIASDFMKEGDKVILATAEPSWVYREIHGRDETYSRLKYFEQVYITDDAYGLVKNKFKLVAMLTGDLHHYSHYIEERDPETTIHYLTAGGGGAFTHATNILPEKLEKLEKDNFPFTKTPSKKMTREPDAVFPPVSTSRRLLFGNLLFVLHNFWFCLIVGGLYGLVAVSMRDFIEKKAVLESVFSLYVALDHPLATSISTLLFFGIYAFADISKSKWFRLWGILHGLVQVLLMISVLNLVLKFSAENFEWLCRDLRLCYNVLLMLVAGILSSGTTMGLYLFLSIMLFDLHITEASSSFKYQHFKNFLRFHISKDGVLTIFPIGIEKVCTKWEMYTVKKKNSINNTEEVLRFDSKEPIKYKLIEDPIVIK